MKVFIRHILLLAKTPIYRVKVRNLPPMAKQDVPYFSQWESRGLNAQILGGDIQTEDDPKWRESGAATKAEYASWSWSGCGMACLKMILAHRNGTTIPLVTLGKKCAEYEGYDLPLETSIGLKYAPFVRFLGQEFHIAAKVVLVMPLLQIVDGLARGKYVMASVSPLIRGPASHPKTKGGHVVLMVGYDLRGQEFYLHNPSGNSSASQDFAAISFADFAKFFSNRGIVIAEKDT